MEGFTRAMSFYFMTECPFLSYLADRGRRWEVFEEMGANGLAVFRNLVEVDQIKYAEILSLNSEEFNKVILARDGKIFHNEDGRVKACNGAHHPTREEIQNLQRFAVVTANVVSVAELVVKADKFRREIKEFLNRMPQELIAMVPEMNPHDPFNLLLCDVIPNDLEDDPVFAAHRCPITGRAIRFPVRDRHHPEHVYERAAIQQWLIDHPSSPLTRELMLLEDLELCPEIQETIDHHLTIYVQLMRDYLHERLAAPHGAQ